MSSPIVKQLVDDISEIKAQRAIDWKSFKDSYPTEPRSILIWLTKTQCSMLYTKSDLGEYRMGDSPIKSHKEILRILKDTNDEAYWTAIDLNDILESAKNLK